MNFNVYDTPYLSDPFVAAFKEMLAGTELTPPSAPTWSDGRSGTTIPGGIDLSLGIPVAKTS